MIFGGIPYYPGYIDGEYSLAQNVDAVFFAKNARLANEYSGAFTNAIILKDLF